MFLSGMQLNMLIIMHQVFFPIYANDHYYVVCFDFLKATICVIDNVRSEEVDVGVRYGDQVYRLVSKQDYICYSAIYII